MSNQGQVQIQMLHAQDRWLEVIYLAQDDGQSRLEIFLESGVEHRCNRTTPLVAQYLH